MQKRNAKLTPLIGGIFLAICCAAQAWAASDDVTAKPKFVPYIPNYVAPQLPPIPDYVKAWPKQVAVEKPDPVLGDKPYWEFWVYSESFAKRFKGFSLEGADPELKGGVHAMVAWIFKLNQWSGVNPNYPKQYVCHLDVYFDSSIKLPLSERPWSRPPPKYPQGVSPSYRRLEPFDAQDEQAIRVSEQSPVYPKVLPMIFVDRPLDGRFSSLGVLEYRPNLVPGLANLSLPAHSVKGACSLVAPKAENGVLWLSLFGDNPYGIISRYTHQSEIYTRDIKLTFDPGPNPERAGYVRMPEALYKAMLPKEALIKVLNWCINQEFADSTRRGKGVSQEARDAISRRCRDAEEQGKVYTIAPGKEGMQLQDTGF
jgi:hypothetical protein